MADERLAAEARGTEQDREIIAEAYDDALLECFDILERNDFYGVAAAHGLRFFGEKLGLTPESHVLELGSGIGGPARLFAKTWGCRVTGIDLSEFNHRTAEDRTKKAGLDHLADFIHGSALEIAVPDESFTHVFGCEALCYFPDKERVYERAYRALRPGGAIAFLEAACDSPVRLRTEEHLGQVHYESIAGYVSKLHAAGFEAVEHFDTTPFVSRDISSALYRLITRKDQVVGAVGEDVYFGLLEIWAEFLAYFAEGTLTHCGIIARKH